MPIADNLFIFPKNSNNIDRYISDLQNFTPDENLIKLIYSVNKKLKLSNVQRENLKALYFDNIFICTTTIKPSFLGGAANTLLKILSVYIQAELLKSRYKKYYFIPLVWIDDDVHDNLESSTAYIFTKKGDIEAVRCSQDLSKTDRTVIHKRVFNKDIEKTIEQIIFNLPETEGLEKLSGLLKQSYKPGNVWSYSTVLILNKIFKNLGILFLFTSFVRKEGFFNNLTAHELSNRGKTYDLIKTKQMHYQKFNIEIPDKSHNYNLNIHKNDKVEKCDKISGSKFTDYSPNIMLKPVFLDSLLPVIFRISSPSEFIYSLLLDDVYSYFEIIKPLNLPRYSVTFMNKATKDFIDETNTDLKEIISGYNRLEKMFPHNISVKKAVNWLYPSGNLQERVLSLVNVVASGRKQIIIRTAKKLKKLEPVKHFILEI